MTALEQMSIFGLRIRTGFGLLQGSPGLRHGLDLRLGFTLWFKGRFALYGDS